MAMIIKQRKTFSVVYRSTDKNGKNNPIWETYFDYPSALKRKLEIEKCSDCGIENITVDTKVIEYLQLYANSIGLQIWSPTRYQSNVGVIHNYIAKAVGNKKIKDFDKELADKIFTNLKAMPALGKRNQIAEKVMPISMLRTCSSIFKSAFDYLVANEIIKENPFLHINIARSPKKTTTVEWTLDNVHCMFQNCEETKLYVFLHIIFSTGLGIYETLGLTWSDVHVDDDCLHNGKSYIESRNTLRRLNKNTVNQLDQNLIIRKFPSFSFANTNTEVILMRKNEGSKKIYIPMKVAMLLREWQSYQASLVYENTEDLVLTLKDGRPYDDRVMKKNFQKLMEQASLSELTLVKLKNFGQKQNDKKDTNASLYYEDLEEILQLPERKEDFKDIMRKKKSMQIKEIFTENLNVEKGMMNELVGALNDDPDLKQELLNKLLGK